MKSRFNKEGTEGEGLLIESEAAGCAARGQAERTD